MRRQDAIPRILLLLLGAILLFAYIPLLAADGSQPVFKPTLQVTKSSGQIEINGQIDDSGWKSAARIDGFVERFPGENIRADVATQVLVTFDDRYLYVAFVCHDNPADIRSTMSQRDQYSGDDAVCMLLDPYGNANWAYEFFVNPYGIQKDQLWTNIIGEDPSYDLIWESAAAVTDSGYQVEMAIPFASMRFPNQDTQSWRVDFWRNRPRGGFKQYSWAANDRNEQCFPCQFGTLTGINGVHPGQGFQLLPTLVAHQSGEIVDRRNANSPFHNANPQGEFSLGGKYAVSSDVTVEGTLNPDFSQIEADAAQIDVNSTISLMYPERRPFFQEGSDIFRTLFNSFYTRTINDPQFAAKLTGRMGGTSIGYLGARDLNTPYMIPLDEASILMNTGKSVANIVRGSRAFGNDSRAGFIFSDRRFEHNGSGSVVAVDDDIRLSKTYSIDGQYILTHTAEPRDPDRTSQFGQYKFDRTHTIAFDGEAYYGTAMITRLKRNARSFGFVLDYDQVSPSYRTEVGYDPLIDYRNLSFGANYTFYPQKSLFSTITPQMYVQQRWKFDGVRRSQFVNVGSECQIRKAQTYLQLYLSRSNELYQQVVFDNLWNIQFNWNSRFSKQVGVGYYVSRGVGIARFAMTRGDEYNYGINLDFKPIDRLVIQPNLAYAQSVDVNSKSKLYSGYITRTRLVYQASRQMSIRLVVQFDDFDRSWQVDPLLTYRLNSFSVFYLGSSSNYNNLAPNESAPSQWRLASRQFFMKIQYLLQT
jgi:hypothetical protein